MHEFYKKALLALIVLVFADALLAAFFIHQSYLSFSLLPADKDGARWHCVTYKEKPAILRFIATSYTNSELEMESVVAETGANRSKVNEVLKSELGMTFKQFPCSYYPQLRLTQYAWIVCGFHPDLVTRS